MNVTGIATSGMSAALGRFDTSAAAIARQDTAEDRKADLAKEAAEIVAAKIEAGANAAVVRTGSRMIGSLVDILA